MIKITYTIKTSGGSYQTLEETFDDQEKYDSWIRQMQKDHKDKKLIGIHNEEYLNGNT